MTKEEIKAINEKCSYQNGIFSEPYGVPVHIKEPVIYKRVETGGFSGGNCWGDDAESCTLDYDNNFEALDLVLEKLKPDISYSRYKMITKLIHTNKETTYEYYGNSTDWKITYIILSELENLLKEF